MRRRPLCTIACFGLAAALLAPAPIDAAFPQAGVSASRRQAEAPPPDLTFVHYRKDVVSCAGDAGGATAAQVSADDLDRIGAPLIAWIVARTRWTVRGMPSIHFVSQAQLTRMFTGGQPSVLVVHSLYCEDDHAIYLPDTWKRDSLLDRSELLHELVHHLQYLNDVSAACPAAYEQQAYEFQAAWLREQGVEDALALMGVSAATIYTLSHCPEF